MTVNQISLVYTEKEVRDYLAEISADILHDEIHQRNNAGTLHELFRKGPFIDNIDWPYMENIDSLNVTELSDEFSSWGQSKVDDAVTKLLGNQSEWMNKTEVKVWLKTDAGTMIFIETLSNEIKETSA